MAGSLQGASMARREMKQLGSSGNGADHASLLRREGKRKRCHVTRWLLSSILLGAFLGSRRTRNRNPWLLSDAASDKPAQYQRFHGGAAPASPVAPLPPYPGIHLPQQFPGAEKSKPYVIEPETGLVWPTVKPSAQNPHADFGKSKLMEAEEKFAGCYQPPTDPASVLKASKLVYTQKPKKGAVEQAKDKILRRGLEGFKNDMEDLGLNMAGKTTSSSEDYPEDLPPLPDDLNPEERAMLNPKIMAKQIKDAYVERYEMMQDRERRGLLSKNENPNWGEMGRAVTVSEKAIEDVKKRPSPRKGNTYYGRVIAIKPFGAFVDFGCNRNGLVPITEICEPPPKKVEEVLYLHDEVAVMVEKEDPDSKVYLTMVGLNPGLRPTKEREAPPEPREPVRAYVEVKEDKKPKKRRRFDQPDWETIMDPLQRKLYEYDLMEWKDKKMMRQTRKENMKTAYTMEETMANENAARWHEYLGMARKQAQIEMAADRDLYKDGSFGHRGDKKKRQQKDRPRRPSNYTSKKDYEYAKMVENLKARGHRTTPRYGGASGLANA
uniref:S1 motif domain-containing protein n=1 Tax=Lotharella globosa TaxID=91324 RepID=A0A7S4DZD7_9EUKA